MLSSIVTVPMAALSKLSSARPIHTLVFTALLGCVVYLSIVDDYITRGHILDSSELSFYHSGETTSSEQWSLVEDSNVLDSTTKNSQTTHLALIPLKFRSRYSTQTPEIDNKKSKKSSGSIIQAEYEGSVEKYLVTNYANYESELNSLNSIVKDQDWTVRQSHRAGKYSEYAKQTIIKLWGIIKGAETYDMILIVFAYMVMWYTFFQIFVEFRNLGSKFWLAFGSLLSSVFAFLFALGFTCKVLNLKISLRTLSEGIPFLVDTVGFKHKVYYTEPILKAINNNKKKKIPDIISDTVKLTSWPLIRYHSIVIFAFFACSIYAPHLEGLRNFCILSGAILISDLLMTFTFYSSILALKAEINKVHQSLDLKDYLEEDGVSADVADLVAGDLNHSLIHKSTAVLVSKIAVIVGFFGVHFFALGTSWLYDSSIDKGFNASDPVNSLLETTAKNLKINSKANVLITIMPAEIFTPVGYFNRAEDLLLNAVTKVSNAITDSFISKCLLLITAISISINVYFLNAARTQLSNIDTLATKRSDDRKAASLEKVSSAKKAVGSSNSTSATSSSSAGSADHKKQQQRTKKSSVVVPAAKKIDNGSDVKETHIMDYTSSSSSSDDDATSALDSQRPFEECVDIMKDGKLKSLNNNEVTSLVLGGKLPLYALEKNLGDNTRAVVVRRKAIAKLADAPVVDSDKLPYKFYDYDRVFGACCENVIGFIPLPLGVAGPLIIDGKPYHIPMATTEGCLVASAMRGCKAINAGGGVSTVLTQDGMTRGPCVSFPSLARVGACKKWLDSEEGSATIKKAFNSTSRFARLQSIKTAMAGTLLFIRFMSTTGDAMGMNMISKGVDHCLRYMIDECGWDDMEIISVSGNYCIDKKSAAINWIEGRGKSVVAEARIPGDVVKKVLKSNVSSLVRCNTNKNLIGSAMAGAVGGFNAQAANLVTAVYLATGQDPAQNVESSNCITLLDEAPNGDLVISVSMPSIEVGTIGGGTILEPQNAMLEMLGVKGANAETPGANAQQLAKIVASAVLSAELSLLSALEAGHLVQSHMQHNRKAAAPTPAVIKAPEEPIPGSCIKS